MNNRDFHSDYNAGPTTAATQIADEVRITFTGVEGDRYVVIATCEAITNTGDPLDVGVEDHPGSNVYYQHRFAAKDLATDFWSCPMIFEFVVPAGGAVDLGLYAFNGGGGSPTVTLRNSSMCMFKLGSNDAITYTFPDPGSDSTTSTTFVPVAHSETTVEVPSDGDYLIMACAQSDKDTAASSMNIRLSIDGSTSNDMVIRETTIGVAHAQPYAAMKPATLAAGTRIIELEHLSVTSGTATTASTTILVLRRADFPRVVVNETSGNFTTTSTTYVENTNIEDDYRLNAYETMILSYGIQWRSSANVEHRMKTTYDGTTIHETSYESIAAGSQSKMVHFAAYGLTPTAGDHTIEQYLSKESAGLPASNLAESVIAVIMMRDDVTVRVLGGSIFGGKIF